MVCLCFASIWNVDLIQNDIFHLKVDLTAETHWKKKREKVFWNLYNLKWNNPFCFGSRWDILEFFFHSPMISAVFSLTCTPPLSIFLVELWCKKIHALSSSPAGQPLSLMPWSKYFNLIWGQPHFAVIQSETCGIKWIRAVGFGDNWQLLRKVQCWISFRKVTQTLGALKSDLEIFREARVCRQLNGRLSVPQHSH